MTDLNKSSQTYLEEEVEGRMRYKTTLEDCVGWVELKTTVETNNPYFFEYTKDWSKEFFFEGIGFYYKITTEEVVGSDSGKSELYTLDFERAKSFFNDIYK